MARLPPYINERSIGTGAEFMRPRTTRDQTSTAVRGIGQQLASVSEALSRVDLQLENKARVDQERADRLDAENVITLTDTDARLKLRQAAENITESGRGFYDNYMKEYDATWQQRLNFIPERLRPEAQSKFMKQREAIAIQAADIEANQRQKFTGKVEGEKVQSLASNIVAGIVPHDMAKTEVETFVDSLQLPPNAAERTKRRMGMAVDEAHIKRQIQLNPEGTLRDLQQYSTAVPRSSNPNVSVAIEAAQRHGIPLNIMLPIIKGESNFDHNADMSKKINPATGRPYSSAYGLGQMIDANWKEVGIPKTADPALQAEAVARLLSKRIDVLNANGIEVTAQNVWGAHFVGPGAFVRLVRADPNTPLRDVLLPLYGTERYRQATTGNGTLLQDGATVGQTLAKIGGYVEKNSRAMEGELRYDPGKDPKSAVEVGGVKLGYMTGQDTSRYIAAAQEVVAQRTDENMKAWLKQQTDDGLLNPFTSSDRKSMDKYAATTGVHQGMNQGDPVAYGSAKAFLNQYKYLPKPYTEEAELAILSPDPKRRQLAYDLLGHVEVQQPMNGLAQSGVTPDIRKRVERYNALQTEMGMTATQARQHVEREFSPEFQDRVKKDADRIKQQVDKTSIKDLEAELMGDRTWGEWWNGPRYGNDAVKGRLLAAYQDRVRYHLTDTGDLTSARAQARADIKKSYGTDDTFGERRVMHWPPSKILPRGEDGTHKWVAEQVTGFVNTALEANNQKYKVQTKDVFLIGTPETARTVMAGQPVFYEVAYRDNKGVVRMLPGGYYVSPEEYKEKMIQSRLNPTAPPVADVAAARQQQARESAQFDPAPTGARRSTMPTRGLNEQ